MILDDICEFFDTAGISGDTPVQIKFDGQEFDLTSITTDATTGTVVLNLEEA